MSEFTPPVCDTNNPADLEAWFGMWGYADHYRKIVLASCREVIRASSTLGGQKLSEARIDDLARLHENYIGFLADCLNGRRLREEQIRATLAGGGL